MLLFRSEETVESWCAARGIPKNPLVTLDQLWVLATEWYATRLTADSRRPSVAEITGILARIGLTGPFWDVSAE